MVTHIALLAYPTREPVVWAVGLNMAYTTTSVALLRGDGSWRRARGRLVAGLPAVVAQALRRAAVLCNVAHW